MDSIDSNKSSEAEIDLAGIPLKNSKSIFIKKKTDLQPKLFLKVPQGRFKAYSKACPAQYSKQPIILTKKEKKYIDDNDKKEGTKSYDEFITYGTDNEKFHYICPRFWCLADKEGKSRSISLKEINSGGCGGWEALIPKGSKKVPEGGRIYEFTDNRFHTEGVKNTNIMVYKPMYPGFIDPSKHPDNLCVPCCFGKPTSNEGSSKPIPNMFKPTGETNPEGSGPDFERDKNGNIILKTVKGEQQVKETSAKVRMLNYNSCNQGSEDRKIGNSKTKKIFDLVPLLETFPLKQNQLGYLTLSEQKFLGFNCQKVCQNTLSDKQLKKNTACLLHKGMERSENQSFLSVLADIFYYKNNIEKFSSPIKPKDKINIRISHMKQEIISHLTLDTFISLQNGNLVEIFNKDDIDINTLPEIEKYKKTKIYNTIKKNIRDEQYSGYFNKIVSAFENFKLFLLDPESVIDYEYLWDFITLPRSKKEGGLFKDGINLIIIKSPQDDITNKIELLCPSNLYSSINYDINKETLFIFSKKNYYEPIYKYTRVSKDTYKIKKLFYLSEFKKTMPEITKIINIVWNNVTSMCSPLPSMPEKYNNTFNFKENISFSDMMLILKSSPTKFKFKSQIINFQNQVIGMLAHDKKNKIYLPCRISNIDQTKPYTFVYDPILLNNYTDTVKILTMIHNITKKKIFCKPVIKIVDNGFIIAILTETNQLISIIPEVHQLLPDGGELDDIKSVFINSKKNHENYIDMEKSLYNNKSSDTTREIKVKQIKLESHFYNIFRNLLRILLNNFEFQALKNNIIEIIESPTKVYNNKLVNIIILIKKIMEDDVEFLDIRTRTLPEINEITQCLEIAKNECNVDNLCSFSETNKKCILQLPKINLVNSTDNEDVYYGRIADELIRFKKIRNYILTSHNFLSFQQISYNLRKNEIILLEELLYGNYFNDLKKTTSNKFINTKNVYSVSEPIDSFPYKNNFNIDIELNADIINSCIVNTDNRLRLGHWKDANLVKLRLKKKPEKIENEIKNKIILNKAIFKEFKLIEYKNTFNCSWELLTTIVNNFGIENTVSDIVSILIQLYKELFDTHYKEKIISILKREGKKEQIKSLLFGTSLEDIITPTNYYISLLDIFLIVNYYKISCVLLSNFKIPLFDKEFVSFINEKNEDTYYIFCGKFRDVDSLNPITYGLLSRENNIKISNNTMYEHFNSIKSNNISTIDEFISNIAIQKIKINKKIKIKIKKR